jgi:uncharacterized protein (TIGR02996 family)
MGIEEVFIRDIQEHPEEEASRLIYADWLDEQGDADRAAFLRAESALTGLPDGDERRAELEEGVRNLRAGLDGEWVARVARPAIENCSVRFDYQCPKRWERLTPLEDARTRYCDHCRRAVHYCQSIEEARLHAWVGDCIAVDPGVARAPGDLESRVLTLGMPARPDLWEGEGLRAGSPVRIVGGTYRGLSGEVEEVQEAQRGVRVAITLFGRPVSIDVAEEDLEAEG